MKIIFPSVVLLLASINCIGQTSGQPLTVEYIMQDPKWIGTSPSAPYWSTDGKLLLFSWNPTTAPSDSVYFISTKDLDPKKTDFEFRNNVQSAASVTFNSKKTEYVYVKNGDIYLTNVKLNKTQRITRTVDAESNPTFIINDTRIAYRADQNVFFWEIATGTTTQLTNFQKGNNPIQAKKDSGNRQEGWLVNDQLRTFEVLKSRKQKKDSADLASKAFPKDKEIKTIYLGDKSVANVVVSPNGRFITYRLNRPATGSKSTIIPNYITESGFTQDINGRTKVGVKGSSSEFYIFDAVADTVFMLKLDTLAGIKDLPDYAKDYSGYDSLKKKSPVRKVSVAGPYWNTDESAAVIEIFAEDHKDKWIVELNAADGKLKILDRQRDESWIGGPGIGGTFGGGGVNSKWVNNENYWFQSEASGYSHIYVVNVKTGIKSQVTSGNFEIQEAQLSNDRKYFYYTGNQVHPGEKHFYRIPVSGGNAIKLTSLTGANQVSLSPDEKYLAILYSYSNKPWELYLQENKDGAKATQVTDLAQSAAFKAYNWRDPEVVQFKASDGAMVYARLYKPTTTTSNKPAVIFVHGAGYLQNAHKWWSTYYREYMFHNLLADQGYTVLDVDYRGSAGYGRDWRTGIYRFMGGKDLSDQVDGAKYLVEQHGVNPKNIGIYGGSYGGFITLMAMFTKPGIFAAGAGLRSVTDWAHYNDPYTSNILNDPYNDSLAYQRSSPLYYADGLKGRLLMCHGMVDVNVHFQDIVRLSQRLIELRKENWELAVYPVEDHGFVEPTSWMDEYKRILKLFNETLKQ